MKPTRRMQPYRRGGIRPVGPALTAMRRGKPFFGANPRDAYRTAAKRRRKRRGTRKLRQTGRA